MVQGSLLRLYHPATQGNSFMLDGFPALKEGKDWQTRLAEFIDQKGVLGMTTNQTLFRQLVETGVLDERLRALQAEGREPQEIYRLLYNEAAMEAARLFGAVHARWPWEGRVSQEASALLTELGSLVREVQRIAGAMQGVGAFTKIPNLKIGPQAIRWAVAGGGVQPNITLVFSDLHYLDTVEGYLLGLKELADRRQPLNHIHSVNSLFVSRVDREIERGRDDLAPLLKGKVAVAQAKIVYRISEAIFGAKPFSDPEGLYADEQGRQMLRRIESLSALYKTLQPLGANRQRLLIASSGVKSDQPYSPLLYVLPFLGPWAANTMPEGTLEAVIRFAAALPEEAAASLKQRSLITEPLPNIPAAAQPVEQWDRAILMTSEERRRAGIKEVSPDRILKEFHEKVAAPRGASLRQLCDTLRDKGAESFTADERATLQALESKLSVLRVG